MFRRWEAVLVCALVVAGTVQAENWVRVWDATGAFDLPEPRVGDVTILSAGTFKIQATGDHEGLGTINSIRVAKDVTGTVRVDILRDPNEGGGPGAYEVNVLNLSGSASTDVGDVWITNDLGRDDVVQATRIVGSVDVEGEVLHNVEIDVLAGNFACAANQDFTAHGVSERPMPSFTGSGQGHIYINGSLFETHLSNLSGLVEVTGSVRLFYASPPGPVTGTIVAGSLESLFLAGPFSGTLETTGNLRYIAAPSGLGGTLHVGGNLGSASGGVLVTTGDFTADLTVDGDVLLEGVRVLEGGFAGCLTVGGDVAESPYAWYYGIYCAGDFTGQAMVAGNLLRAMRVHGDLRGLIDVAGNLGSATATGLVLVDGHLGDPYNPADPNDPTVLIHVHGERLGAESGVTIDNDGWHGEGMWVSGYAVRIGPATYTGNAVNAHVYLVQPCKGDMDNSGDVGFSDIDGFVAAIPDGGTYDASHPGLAASRAFHGDMNCSGPAPGGFGGAPGFDDIDLFIATIPCYGYGTACCRQDRGDGMDGGAGPDGADAVPHGTPAETAALLATHVAPEHYGTLLDVVSQTAALHPDPQRRAYWLAVYRALTN